MFTGVAYEVDYEPSIVPSKHLFLHIDNGMKASFFIRQGPQSEVVA